MTSSRRRVFRLGLVALLLRYKQRMTRAIYIPKTRFNFQAMTDSTARYHFRFTLHQLKKLTVLLEMNDQFEVRYRYKVSALEALCITLNWLAWPHRLGSMCTLFGRSREAISTVFTDVVNHIYERFKHLLIWDFVRLDERWMQNCAEAIFNKGGQLTTCIGFIDGTVRGIARPGNRLQKPCYNGHKVAFCTIYFNSYNILDTRENMHWNIKVLHRLMVWLYTCMVQNPVLAMMLIYSTKVISLSFAIHPFFCFANLLFVNFRRVYLSRHVRLWLESSNTNTKSVRSCRSCSLSSYSSSVPEALLLSRVFALNAAVRSRYLLWQFEPVMVFSPYVRPITLATSSQLVFTWPWGALNGIVVITSFNKSMSLAGVNRNACLRLLAEWTSVPTALSLFMVKLDGLQWMCRGCSPTEFIFACERFSQTNLVGQICFKSM